MAQLQDRKEVAGNQGHEIKHIASYYNIPETKVREAIAELKKAGRGFRSRKMIYKKLRDYGFTIETKKRIRKAPKARKPVAKAVETEKSITNFYPEKPMVPFVRTTVTMPEVITYLQSLTIPVEVKRATYVVFRNESANGTSGLNFNFVGCQADSGRWPAKYDDVIIGVVKKNENQTGKVRLFCAFKSFKVSVDFLSERLQARGVFVGGFAGKIAKMQINTADDLARAYTKEWVQGSATAEPTTQAKNGFLSMYRQATGFFA